MRAVVWHGRRDVRVEDVADPTVQEPTDAIVRVTSSGLCGSDLHLYEVLAPFMEPGDVLGHEPIGVVEEIGRDVGTVAVGDRVVVPFNIACGRCLMCDSGLQSQCETTQVRAFGCGAALFGYTKLYGQVPGAQAELLRVPHAGYGLVPVPHGPPDDRFVYLSDVMPTAWQALEYAGVHAGGSLCVLGLGPIGDMCVRLALARGITDIVAVDLVDERLARAARLGVTVLDVSELERADLLDSIRELTAGRGPDAVIDAVGMEAHGSPVARAGHRAVGLLPDRIAESVMLRAGVDRLAAFRLAVDVVRRGGTISLAGVYGGMADPVPMMTMFDKQVTLRMGQANVKRWIDDLMPFVTDDDPLGLDGFASHRLPLDQAPEAYEAFQAKRDGFVKVVFRP